MFLLLLVIICPEELVYGVHPGDGLAGGELDLVQGGELRNIRHWGARHFLHYDHFSQVYVRPSPLAPLDLTSVRH